MNIYSLHFGMTSKLLIHLRRFLNEILRLNPPLAETDKFDKELGAAIGQFIVRYNSLYPNNKLPIKITVSNEIWAAIGVMLGEKRLRDEIEFLKNSEPIIVRLLQGLPPVVLPPYTKEMQECDVRIASLFGGEGSIVATVYEPKTLLSPNAGGYRVDHLANDGVFHIYANEKGTETKVGLFVPGGFEYLRGGEYESLTNSIENYFRFICRKGKYSGVEISFVHVAGTYGGEKGGNLIGKEFIKTVGVKKVLIGRKNKAGSVQIGYIGGLGGEGTGYHHTHVNVYLNGRRYDPRKIFCS